MSWEEFLDKLEKDNRARKRLAEIIVTDYDVRIALINAVLRDVATKQDIMEMRNEVRGEIPRLENEFKNYVDKRIEDLNKKIEDLNRRIDDLNNLVRVSLIAIIITLATTILVPLILKFLTF
ncbi:MAG: hypothetical protein H5T50_02745 [Nitrososphaeria archaeon]|nr:hypothetical protein [Nitrososphaeria archaeon]